jgi:ribosomal protein S19E (S16A)
MKTKFIVGLLGVAMASSVAEAKVTKYYYLRFNGGVQAYKTMAACEAVKRNLLAFEKKIEKIGGVKQSIKPRCLDVLPYGYERRRGSSLRATLTPSNCRP